jgi:DNA-binding NarL/FixJ family response regulator
MNQQSDSSPVQVLVVDDHALFVESLRARFEQDDRFEVVGTAADGRAAVKLARAHEGAVVLMDLSMPGLDGLAATRRLRALEAPPHVIALSGHLDRLSREAAEEAGADAFVSKATAFDELAETILRVCGRTAPA